MKYKFVYDESYLNAHFELSYEEKKIVLITVLGRHNAIFFGYKPERLVRAIKMLKGENVPFIESNENVCIEDFCGGGPQLKQGLVTDADKGILYMKNVHEHKSSVLEMTSVPISNKQITLCRGGESVTYPADIQLIGTTTSCPCGNYLSTSNPCLCSLASIKNHWRKVNIVAERCDIVYKCADDVTRRQWGLAELMNEISEVNNFSASVCDISKDRFTPQAEVVVDRWKEEHPVSNKTEELLGRLLKVAKTLAITNCHYHINSCDVLCAFSFYKPLNPNII